MLRRCLCRHPAGTKRTFPTLLNIVVSGLPWSSLISSAALGSLVGGLLWEGCCNVPPSQAGGLLLPALLLVLVRGCVGECTCPCSTRPQRPADRP
ncbi:hypothetical protein C2E23DRAFT_816068 [Lenzites betulinus]|nr:hypothetical protein C2E23DRAFT_816068 [Lenzites betulinus]